MREEEEEGKAISNKRQSPQIAGIKWSSNRPIFFIIIITYLDLPAVQSNRDGEKLIHSPPLELNALLIVDINISASRKQVCFCPHLCFN